MGHLRYRWGKLFDMSEQEKSSFTIENIYPKTVERDKTGNLVRAKCSLCEEAVIFDASHVEGVEARAIELQTQWVHHFNAKHANGNPL